MSKTITMKCHDCLNQKSFKVGAGSELQSLKDAVALVTDEKTLQKIMNLMVAIESKKPKEIGRAHV